MKCKISSFTKHVTKTKRVSPTVQNKTLPEKMHKEVTRHWISKCIKPPHNSMSDAFSMFCNDWGITKCVSRQFVFPNNYFCVVAANSDFYDFPIPAISVETAVQICCLVLAKVKAFKFTLKKKLNTSTILSRSLNDNLNFNHLLDINNIYLSHLYRDITKFPFHLGTFTLIHKGSLTLDFFLYSS